MKTRLFIIVTLFFFTTVILGEQASIKPEKELLIVENQLKVVLSKLGDKVKFKYLDNKAFEVSNHTRKFMIHSGTMIGKFSEQASERVGPDYDGFMLFVELQDAGVVNQAMTPQVIRSPYWNTYVDVTGITGTKKQIYWGLSFWGGTAEKILSQIKESLWNLNKSRKINDSDEQQAIVKKGEELTGIFKKNLKSESPYRLEMIGGNSLNLRGKILQNLKEDSIIWITGQIHTKLYKSPSPNAAIITHWDVWMEVENYKVISNPLEIPRLDQSI